MNIVQLETERTILKRIDQSVMDYVFRKLDVEDQKSFLGLSSNEALAKELNNYEQGLSTYNKKFVYFQIIDKQYKHIIGWCGYHTWYTDHDRAEIGYGLFDENYKRKGIMSEVMPVVIAYGFEELQLHRIEAFIGPDNTASLALIKKMKFREEGRLREHYVEKGKADDSIVFGLLKIDSL